MGADGARHSTAHEIGHHVERHLLSGEDRRRWAEISGFRPAGQCVSEHARSNWREDFAESYRSYMLDPESLRKVSPDKYAFLRDRVFDEREYGTTESRAEARFSEIVQKNAHSSKELEVYREAGLSEARVCGRPALVRLDIDPRITDDFDRTNLERMEAGQPPLNGEGRPLELHHIGQHDNSPIAELKYSEHRGAGNMSILHQLQESEIDRGNFHHFRAEYWKERARQIRSSK